MESTTLLKDILLDKGQIHKYYEGMVPVNLWRGLNVKKNMELFELIEDDVILSNGRPRPADISVIGEGADAKINVKESPRGIMISLVFLKALIGNTIEYLLGHPYQRG
ncbi:hypothetical protein LY624_18895 [Pseudoalteromonas sp. N1230-9]|uniref:hypothetical protein n=1 Tax=Pseudoalteromonas sp. N1230-9 TaxID=2907156 RepID=UPI002B2F7897|nr:hypothetical protein LY624_18895 [Pseudoalteromonas sp. N1230-9]